MKSDTADELIIAIDSADDQACARVLHGQDEKSRHALYPAVAQKARELDAALKIDFGKSRTSACRCYIVARLALLGTASFGELKQQPPWQFQGETAYRILAGRRPVWLADWAEFELEKHLRNWATVRALVRDALIPKPAAEFYTLGMILAPHRNVPPREFLHQDPALLDDELWRLFTCEGSGELSLAAYDKYVAERNTWLEAFRSMAADQTLDRGRVLTSTLEALARDFAPFRAGWFSRLHESLKPDRTERIALGQRYLDLLASRVPATVSFAMKALVEVDRAGAFDLLASLDQLGPALEARDKGTVERALSLLRKAVRNGASGSTKPRIAAVAARALTHESADVQSLALELVQDHPELVAEYRSVLAPSVLAGVEVSSPRLEQEPTIAVAELPRIRPLESAAEIAEWFAAVLESQGPPADIERVLDGVARISAPERLTSSLARRAEKVLERRDHPQPRAALAGLALAWTRGHRTPPPAGEDNLRDFLLWRVWCLAEQVAQHRERPLLSLPTWADGRLDPTELARRIAAQPAGESERVAADRASLFHLDLLQARLRTGEALSNPLPQLQVTWHTQTWEASGKTYSHHRPRITAVASTLPTRFDPLLLSTVSFTASLEMKRWCATVCPAWREGWFAAGCRDLGYNLDWWEANWSTRAYLETLLEPHTPLGPMAGLLLALGLGARESGENMLAVDALIAGVADGRLSGPALGGFLVDAASSNAIKLVRWSQQLARAAQAGQAQARAIFAALELFFASGLGVASTGYSKLVELQWELACQTGLRMSLPAAIRALQGISTAGKMKRLVAGLVS